MCIKNFILHNARILYYRACLEGDWSNHLCQSTEKLPDLHRNMGQKQSPGNDAATANVQHDGCERKNDKMFHRVSNCLSNALCFYATILNCLHCNCIYINSIDCRLLMFSVIGAKVPSKRKAIEMRQARAKRLQGTLVKCLTK